MVAAKGLNAFNSYNLRPLILRSLRSRRLEGRGAVFPGANFRLPQSAFRDDGFA